ncbi:MAG TPA: protease pro-enzyme activation domain-containing protein, partial [Acidimicrobiales bacterium]|nr:protease pro-enzyme activation domain-containing protein [Acidimicrobiales bacterium]
MKPLAPLAAIVTAAAGPMLAFCLAAPSPAAAATTWSATATQAVPSLNGAVALGQLPGTTPVHIAVGLALRNRTTLDNFIADASTPSSSEFGAAYTPQGFDAAFGPTASSVDAVTGYLEGNGFSGVSASSNGLLVSASGTAAEAEQAFHTTLTEYSLGGAVVYANSTAAMVPQSLSGTVVGVLGLNDVFKATPTPATKSTLTAPSTTLGYTPQGFQRAYQATGTATGSETAIATISSAKMTSVIVNLRTEEKKNGLPQVPVTVEYAGLVNPTTTSSANVEWDLDSQFSTGMADNVSHFYFYDSTSLATVTL